MLSSVLYQRYTEKSGVFLLQKQAFLFSLGKYLAALTSYGEMRDVLQDYAGFPVEDIEEAPQSVARALGKPRWAAAGRVALLLLVLAAGAWLPLVQSQRYPFVFILLFFIDALPFLVLGVLFPWALYAALGGKKFVLLRQLQPAPLSRAQRTAAAVTHGVFVAALVFLLWFFSVCWQFLPLEQIRVVHHVMVVSLRIMPLLLVVFAVLLLRRSLDFFPLVCHGYLLFTAVCHLENWLGAMADVDVVRRMIWSVSLCHGATLAAFALCLWHLRSLQAGVALHIGAPPEKSAFVSALAQQLLFRASYAEMHDILSDYSGFPTETIAGTPERAAASLKPGSVGPFLRLALVILVLAGGAVFAFQIIRSVVPPFLFRAYLPVAILSPVLFFFAMGGRKLALAGKAQPTALPGKEVLAFCLVHAVLVTPFFLTYFCILNGAYEYTQFFVNFEVLAAILLLLLCLLLAYRTLTCRVVYFPLFCLDYLLLCTGLYCISLQKQVADFALFYRQLGCGIYYFAAGLLVLSGLVLYWKRVRRRVSF